jgi:hypothetical protein
LGADGSDLSTHRIIETVAEDEPDDENDEQFTLDVYRKNVQKRAENLLVLLAHITKELGIPYAELQTGYTEAAVYDIWHSILLAKGVEIRSETKQKRDAGFTSDIQKDAEQKYWDFVGRQRIEKQG